MSSLKPDSYLAIFVRYWVMYLWIFVGAVAVGACVPYLLMLLR